LPTAMSRQHQRRQAPSSIACPAAPAADKNGVAGERCGRCRKNNALTDVMYQGGHDFGVRSSASHNRCGRRPIASGGPRDVSAKGRGRAAGASGFQRQRYPTGSLRRVAHSTIAGALTTIVKRRLRRAPSLNGSPQRRPHPCCCCYNGGAAIALPTRSAERNAALRRSQCPAGEREPR
jgi:hypothetical protein